MTAFVIATAACSHLVFNPARTTFDGGDQVLGGGGVEAIVELHGTPDAEVAIALENGLHALSAVHLAGLLAVHCAVQGTGRCRFWGRGALIEACRTSGVIISINL
jgi:hypothetical protein